MYTNLMCEAFTKERSLALPDKDYCEYALEMELILKLPSFFLLKSKN